MGRHSVRYDRRALCNKIGFEADIPPLINRQFRAKRQTVDIHANTDETGTSKYSSNSRLTKSTLPFAATAVVDDADDDDDDDDNDAPGVVVDGVVVWRDDIAKSNATKQSKSASRGPILQNYR
jgi:hypothetical protein